MKYDTEFTMAIDATFNSILNGIQLSRLNFSIHLTPFAAYITLKKSTQVDRNGDSFAPSPPLCSLLQQAYKDQITAQEEIIGLRASLQECEQSCHLI